MQRVKIAYILSVGHSGSSLLDVLLGSSTKAVSIGEVKLDSKGHISNTLCTCGKQPKECEFWGKIDQIAKQHGNSIFDIDFTNKVSESSKGEIINFYRNIASVANAELVVDSSKSIARLRALLSIGEQLDLRLIFLERTPFGVIASNLRKGRSWIRHTFAYLLNNSSRREFASKYEHLPISYEEISSNPDLAVKKIYQYLDVDVTNDDLSQPSLTAERHMLGGNSMLYKPLSEIKEDTRWKSELTPIQKIFIGMVCHPIVQAITYSFIAMIRTFKRITNSRRIKFSDGQ